MRIRVPLLSFLYSLLELPFLGIEVFLRLYLLSFLKDRLQIPIDIVSLVLVCGLVLEAIFVRRAGQFGDFEILRGKSRWPLVMAGALVSGLSLVGLFLLPRVFPEAGLGAQVLGLFLAFATQLSLGFSWVNYAALAGDLINKSRAYALITLRAVMGSLAPFLVVLVTGKLITLEHPEALRQAAWFFCILLFLLGFASSLARPLFRPRLSSWTELEGPDLHAPETGFGSAHLPSSMFLLLLGYFVFEIGLTLSAGSQMYYLKEFQSFDPEEIQEAAIGFTAILVGATALWGLIYHFLRRRWSAYAILIPSGLLLVLPMFFVFCGLLPRDKNAIHFWVLGWTAAFTAPFFLLEYQLFRLGVQTRKVGEAYGLWWTPFRLGRAMGMVGLGLALNWSGLGDFDPRAADRIALLHGPIAAGFIVTATVLFAAAWVFSKRGTRPSVLGAASSPGTSPR